MALSKIKGVKIKGITSVLPSNKEDNLMLPNLDLKQKEEIVKHTGIRYRHVTTKKETPIKELFKNAIHQLTKSLKWELNSVDVLIVVTQTAQTPIPSLACEIHGELDFPTTALTYDINSGCSGFVYGLHTVSQLLASLDQKYKRAILCCGDISSSLTEENDMAVKPIFSDAVSAIGLEWDANSESYFNLETFGKGKKAISLEKNTTGNWMRMDGIDVFNYAIKYVPNNIKTLLKKYAEETKKPEMYFLHQANLLINKSIIKSIEVKESAAPNSLYDFGNTASASIPLTFSLNWPNQKTGWVLFSGFGVGFSVASALVKIDDIKISQPQFVII
jgi:3-oxoacyl-[acyl-carrier-protein] synthase-3